MQRSGGILGIPFHVVPKNAPFSCSKIIGTTASEGLYLCYLVLQ